MQPFKLPDFYVPWPARLNPNLKAARTHSKTWACEMGILGTHADEDNSKIWDEATFDRHDYALFCAYVHPEAPTDELNLMTDWNIWAFYVDDYFLQFFKRPKDRDGGKKYLDRVLLFMPIDLTSPPTPTNPMERALTDLWLRTAPAKSEAWRRRIIEDTKNLLAAFLWELDSMSQNRLSNPIEYIQMRRQVGAALWSADLVEHAMFLEVPDQIATTRPMRVLKDTFADGVHLRNDIFSYEREVIKEGELTNAILVIERFLNVSTQRATNLVNDLLTSRLQQFEHTVITELEPLFDEHHLDPLERTNVLSYVRGLQDWQSGAHEWHIQTSRYLNPRPKQALNTTSPFPHFLGIGYQGNQITSDTLGLQRFKKYMHIPHQTVGPMQLPKFYMPFTTWINPHLETAREHSKTWAHQVGMLDPLPGSPHFFIWDERRFDVTDLAFCSALLHPDATIDQLDIELFWLVWGTYTDDYFTTVYLRTLDMAGAQTFHTRLLEFMPLDGLSPSAIPLTPVERGLADLWTRIVDTLDMDARHLFRKTIDEMTGSWLWELSNQIQNRIPDPVDYIEMRRKTCGSYFMINIPRLTQESIVPLEVYYTHTIQELHNAAINYGFLTNDIFSYQKEIEFEGEMHNCVLVIQNFMGCDCMEAVEIVNNLMTARIKQFEHIVEKELPILFENFNLDTKAQNQLLGHVEELQRFVCGQLQWHFKTERYTETEFRRLDLTRPFLGGPTGLGTTAAHILDESDKGYKSLTPSPPIETPKEIKTFAVSHLALPLVEKQEEAQ